MVKYRSHHILKNKIKYVLPLPELVADGTGPLTVEPIISVNFFCLTSSSFSKDLSRGLMPTIYTTN